MAKEPEQKPETAAGVEPAEVVGAASESPESRRRELERKITKTGAVTMAESNELKRLKDARR